MSDNNDINYITGIGGGITDKGNIYIEFYTESPESKKFLRSYVLNIYIAEDLRSLLETYIKQHENTKKEN